jgi:Cys-tRNA(Pro)/Cys-tRNA(Cys) deacylase
MTAGTRAIDVLRRAGIEHQVHTYAAPERHGRDRDARPAYGADAAAALGIPPERVCKTLAVVVDERMVLAVVPVDRELDLKALAEACAGRKAVLADPAAAERATGYVVGGISPLGSRRPLPVVLDQSALTHTTIFVSAGRRGVQVELAPGDLIRCAAATVARIARPADGSSRAGSM